jgi:SAM-dependent methyltransferase
MAQIARSRNVAVCLAVGEHLPFGDSQFDFALLVTVVCFAKDIAQLLREARRVTRVGGKVIIAFIDRDSALGQLYESRKEKFYKEASFYSAPDIVALARQAGLGGFQFCQTIMGLPGNRAAAYKVHEGYGTGAFVAASATRLDLQGGRPVGGYR